MADVARLERAAERRGGSSPFLGTIQTEMIMKRVPIKPRVAGEVIPPRPVDINLEEALSKVMQRYSDALRELARQ